MKCKKKTDIYAAHVPSDCGAAACFLTVCKIELDTVGNLTSRQTRIFFTPQVLVFLWYFCFLSCSSH